jgi:hypothetical protein
MNEKIKQLWDDSIEEFSKQHRYATIMLPEPLREKFAELIVRECAKVADIADESKCEWIGGNILIHFGVEE